MTSADDVHVDVVPAEGPDSYPIHHESPRVAPLIGRSSAEQQQAVDPAPDVAPFPAVAHPPPKEPTPKPNPSYGTNLSRRRSVKSEDKTEYDFLQSFVTVVRVLLGLEKNKEFVPQPLSPSNYRPPQVHFFFTQLITGIRTLAVEMITIFLAVFIFATQIYGDEDLRDIFPTGESIGIFFYMLFTPLVTWIMVVSLTFEYTLRTYVFYRMLEEGTVLDMRNPNMLVSIPMWWLTLSNVLIICWMFWRGATTAAVIVLFRTVNVITFFTKIISAERNTVTLNELLEDPDIPPNQWPQQLSALLAEMECVKEEEVAMDIYCIHKILEHRKEAAEEKRRAVSDRGDRKQQKKLDDLEYANLRATLWDEWQYLGSKARFEEHDRNLPGIVEVARKRWARPEWYAAAKKESGMKADVKLMMYELKKNKYGLWHWAWALRNISGLHMEASIRPILPQPRDRMIAKAFRVFFVLTMLGVAGVWVLGIFKLFNPAQKCECSGRSLSLWPPSLQVSGGRGSDVADGVGGELCGEQIDSISGAVKVLDVLYYSCINNLTNTLSDLDDVTR